MNFYFVRLLTTSRWISNYIKSIIKMEGNTLKWSYREFKNGKLIGQGSSYSKRIKKGGY